MSGWSSSTNTFADAFPRSQPAMGGRAGRLGRSDPPERHDNFLAAWWVHNTRYGFAAIGGH
jgi:hypothetical protein